MADGGKRRWLRFSLRGLFLAVTAFTLWLGWNASIVHNRSALLAKLRMGDSYVMDDEPPPHNINHSYSMTDVYAAQAVGHATQYSDHGPTGPYAASTIRRWMGDKPRWLIAYRPGPDISEVTRLFPETIILLVEPNDESRRR